MKNRLPSSKSAKRSLSRRNFLAKTAAAAAGLTIVPRRVLGGVNYVAPSDKINIAFIGVGSQGFRVMLHFLRESDVQGVAVCARKLRRVSERLSELRDGGRFFMNRR